MLAPLALAAIAWSTPALPVANFSGTITVQDYALDPVGLGFAIEVRNVGSTVPLQTANVTLGVGGSYSFSLTVPAGTYDVAAKAPNRWMRKVVSSVVITGSGGSANFTVPNGDVDGDNVVDMLDYSLVNFYLGSTYSIPADLDGDEEVSIADFAIVASQLFIQGDP
ncbi:MAG: hypothetical protein K1X67_00110 [Fimbriimonadaceae bacterium]|nr:hypothetical protein [Fimbriimonadaceae bacterium]